MIGTNLSHFHIVEKIGEGGMGVVYRAEDERLRRPVALKVLPPELVSNEERRLRFLREARAAAAVSHPNIAAVYDIGEAEGVVFIAMELVEGKTLRELLGGRPLPIKDALRVAMEMAEGLAHAHQAHVIHRDLKPDNVIVRPDQHVKILDFGLAKLLEEHTAASTEEQSKLETISGAVTRAGKVLGTPAYMCPEQARGDKVDARSDLFAFGITLYEMVTGRVPFHGRTTTDTLSAILRDQPLPPSRLNADVTADLEQVVGKCLEKEPEERYQDTRDLLVDLRRLKRVIDSGVPAARTSVAPVTALSRSGWSWIVSSRSRRLAAVIPLATVVVSALFGTWWLIRSPGQFHSSDRIIVADFENVTDRPHLDAAIRDAFEQMLAQSSFLEVTRGEPLRELAAARGISESARITHELAERICGRGECAGFLIGRIEPEGAGYRVSASLERAGKGVPVQALSAAAPGEGDLLRLVYQMVLDFRRRLGESPQSVSATPPPTTHSLLAYQAFARADRLFGEDKQAPLYEKAVELDPDFVDAYARLANVYMALGRWMDSRRAAEEAYRRSEEVPARSRLWNEIEFLYASYDFDTVVDRLKKYQALYPLDSAAPSLLGYIYLYVYQDPISAESAERRAYQISPRPDNLGMLSRTLSVQGKVDEIESAAGDLRKRRGSSEWADLNLVLADLVRGNWKQIEQRAERLEREPGYPKTIVTEMRVLAYLGAGQLGRARLALAPAWRAARDSRNAERQHRLGLLQVWLDTQEAVRPVAVSPEQFELAQNSLLYFPELVTFCVDAGIDEPVLRLLRLHEANEGESTSRFVQEELRFAHGSLALIRGQATIARQILQPLALNSALLRRHRVLGRTYENLKLWREAAAEYEEILRNPHIRWLRSENPAVWVLDQYRLAQVYERLGDTAHARQWYERFLADWKDADPDIPEIIQARQRVAALSTGAAGAQ